MSNKELDLEMMKLGRDDDIEFDCYGNISVGDVGSNDDIVGGDDGSNDDIVGDDGCEDDVVGDGGGAALGSSSLLVKSPPHSIGTLTAHHSPGCATHTYIGAWGGFSSCLRGRAGHAVHHHEGCKLLQRGSVLVLGKLTTKLRIDCRRPAGAAPTVRAGRSEEKIARRKLHQPLGLGPAGLYQTNHMIF